MSGPTWQDVLSRDYRAWDREHVLVDTAGQTAEQSVAMVRAALPAEKAL